MDAPTDQMNNGLSASQSAIEAEVATLLVETLQLETEPGAIAPDEPLFNEGLGLDSIDALEISLALSRRYGIELKSDDDRNGQIFASLRSLASGWARVTATCRTACSWWCCRRRAFPRGWRSGSWAGTAA